MLRKLKANIKKVVENKEVEKANKMYEVINPERSASKNRMQSANNMRLYLGVKTIKKGTGAEQIKVKVQPPTQRKPSPKIIEK